MPFWSSCYGSKWVGCWALGLHSLEADMSPSKGGDSWTRWWGDTNGGLGNGDFSQPLSIGRWDPGWIFAQVVCTTIFQSKSRCFEEKGNPLPSGFGHSSWLTGPASRCWHDASSRVLVVGPLSNKSQCRCSKALCWGLLSVNEVSKNGLWSVRDDRHAAVGGTGIQSSSFFRLSFNLTQSLASTPSNSSADVR